MYNSWIGPVLRLNNFSNYLSERMSRLVAGSDGLVRVQFGFYLAGDDNT